MYLSDTRDINNDLCSVNMGTKYRFYQCKITT